MAITDLFLVALDSGWELERMVLDKVRCLAEVGALSEE